MPTVTATKPTVVPVGDLKDTARFCQTVRESNGPVVVTRNGYDEFFVLTPDLFHEYEMIRRRQEIYAEVDAAEARLEAGQGIPARDTIAQVRQRHGL